MSKKISAKDAELYKKNKRYNTSKTLQTNNMWSKTIGHDPHANIVHDLDISVQALHGGGESEEFKNLSRLVAKSRGTGGMNDDNTGRSWRGKKPLKGTFSVAACYDDINSYMNVGSGDNNVNDNYNSSDEEDEEELSSGNNSISASSSSSSSSESEDEAVIAERKRKKKMKKKMKKQLKKEKKKLKKQKKKEKKKLKKEKKKLKKEKKKKRKQIDEEEEVVSVKKMKKSDGVTKKKEDDVGNNGL